MRTRLSILLAVALATALSGSAADAGQRTARPTRSWRSPVRVKRAPLRARNVRRFLPLRRPRVVATASESRHHPALGLTGPLGPYGPLGRLGPVIDTAWSPSRWMRSIGDWSHMSAVLTELGGPLSEDGPLGPDGPLGSKHDRFPATFRSGGQLAVLGPDGPLGARGPLGPLGPMGAHGFTRDRSGRYLDRRGKVRRSITVPYQGGRRTYPLFEVYDADVAAAMNDNDTSFMAVGNLRRGASYSFPFRAPANQNLHVSLTPHAQLDRFRLEILDGAGNLVASSDSAGQINRVELFVPARTRLQARVTLTSSGHLLTDKPFSLAVVGAPAD